MGSSASFSVSLTGGLLQAFGAPNLTRELVCKWAFECEKLFHGRPSGIDNSICTYGGAMLFRNGQITERLEQLNGFEIALVYTNVPRNTKQLVAQTSSRRTEFPSVINPIFDSIDAISLAQWSQIQTGSGDYERARTLVTINQSLLTALGAGHSAIDDIVQTAGKFDLASKLTGAGGGGTVFILLKPGELTMASKQMFLCILLTKELFTHKLFCFFERSGKENDRCASRRTQSERLQKLDGDVGQPGSVPGGIEDPARAKENLLVLLNTLKSIQ